MSEFRKICAVFVLVVGVILIAAIASKMGRKNGYKQGYSDALANAKTDTVWRYDTAFYEKPIEVIKWNDRVVYVPIPDSVIIHHHDTTYVALQFEKKMYSDSTYSAQISGFEPSLDWIKVHQKTAYITNTITEYKPYKWTLSAFAEGGATLYRFDVRAGLEYERQIAGPLRGAIRAGYEYGNIGRGVFVEGGVKLQILKK